MRVGDRVRRLGRQRRPLRDRAGLARDLAQVEADARQLAKEAIIRWEDRIEDVIKIGAGDRKTALRWITGTEKFYHEQDVEHFVWEQGLLSSFAYNYGKALAKELVDIVEFEDMEWA